jgi:hypothetical protein
MILLATMALCVGVQTPTPVEAEPEAPATPETPAVEQLTDDEAKDVLAAYKLASRDRKASLAARVEAVEALGEGSHEKLVKPLVKIVARERALSVRRAAAKALGHQPPKHAHKALLKLIDDRAIRREPNLIADLVGSLDTAGYETRDWEMLEKLFGTDYAEPHRPKQKAIIVLARNHEELAALDLLLANLDEPAPVNVNDPMNPPAEYWERRWKAWRAWRDDVKAALFAITGQRFNTSAEAREWLEKNRRELRRR